MLIGKAQQVSASSFSPAVSALRDQLGVNASRAEKAALKKLGETFADPSFRSAAMTESAINDDLFDDKYSDEDRERLMGERAGLVELRAATFHPESKSLTILMYYGDSEWTTTGKAGLEPGTLSPVAALDVEPADEALMEKQGYGLAIKGAILGESGSYFVKGGTAMMTDPMVNVLAWQVQIEDVVDGHGGEAVALVSFKGKRAEVTLEQQGSEWFVKSVVPAPAKKHGV